MEINLNAGRFAQTAMDTAEAAHTKTVAADRQAVLRPGNAFARISGTEHNPLAASEPIMEVPSSALARDDALGRLVNAAFNLPPPPAPQFP